MPLILKQEDEERWLKPNLSDSEITDILKVYPPQGMAAHPVKKEFKNMIPFDPEIISEDWEQGKLDF